MGHNPVDTMEYIIIASVALLASLLTFVSGFGLGTILMPVFAIFFPVEVAIALTGIVHLLNNLFKMALVGKSADWRVVLKFGIPAIFAAFIGAWVLINITDDSALFEYTIGTHKCSVTPVKLTVSILMFAFAILEIIPFFKKLEFSENKLMIGGAISTVLFQLVKYGFGVYLTHMSTYRILYGALATIPLFLIWLYFSWTIILLGALITNIIATGVPEVAYKE